MIDGIDVFSSQNDSENKFSEAARAEEYTRMYKWMTEDFATTKDALDLSSAILAWAKSIEKRLARLGHSLSNHTHVIPPHYHANAGPQIGGLKTGSPISPASLSWDAEKSPFSIISNTTGSKSNLKNNRVVTDRVPVVGDKEYGSVGRELKIPILSNTVYNKVIIK